MGVTTQNFTANPTSLLAAQGALLRSSHLSSGRLSRNSTPRKPMSFADTGSVLSGYHCISVGVPPDALQNLPEYSLMTLSCGWILNQPCHVDRIRVRYAYTRPECIVYAVMY